MVSGGCHIFSRRTQEGSYGVKKKVSVGVNKVLYGVLKVSGICQMGSIRCQEDFKL